MLSQLLEIRAICERIDRAGGTLRDIDGLLVGLLKTLQTTAREEHLEDAMRPEDGGVRHVTDMPSKSQ
jgi:hypothetical protein